MASSDGLDEDCVLQRGRSQSDPSSITEVRLGEAHRAGKEEKVGVRVAGWGGGGCWTHVGRLSPDQRSVLEEIKKKKKKD